MPLFESLAAICAPGLGVNLLIGIALVESGGEPLIVRDGGRTEIVSNAGAGVPAAFVGTSDSEGSADFPVVGSPPTGSRESRISESAIFPVSEVSLNVCAALPSRAWRT